VANPARILESDSNQYSLTAEEILSVKFLQSTIQGTTLDKIKVSEEFSRLKIRRKPIRISYKPNTDSGELIFKLKLCFFYLNCLLKQR
jgi:hypothetical protein